jgi:hypothetical protein
MIGNEKVLVVMAVWFLMTFAKSRETNKDEVSHAFTRDPMFDIISNT